MTSPHEPVQQPGVPIQPVPTMFHVAQARVGDGVELGVLVQFSTPIGVAAYFLDPEAASKLGARLSEAAGASKSGLHLPGQ